MDRDLKGIIDSVDVKDKTQSVLERKIESLKEEIARLNYTIQEQITLIASLKSSGSDSGLEVDDDIKFLKDMIFTQRQEILEKDREVDDLKLEIDKYIARLEKEGIADDQEKLKEALKEADRRIEQLNNTIEQYQSNDENAQEIIKQMTREKEASYNEIKMLKRKVTDLEAKDFTYIESVDLKNAKEQIEELQGEMQNLQGEIVDLQQELEDTSKQLLEKLERAEQLKIENESFKVETDLLKAHIANMEKQLDDSELIEKLEVAKKTIETLRGESSILESKISTMEDELKIARQSSQEVTDTTSKHVKKIEKENKNYQAELEKLTEKYQVLEEKYKKKKKKKKKKEEPRIEEGEFVTSLLEASDTSQEIIEQTKMELEEYKAQVFSLSQELTQANDTIKELSETSQTQLSQLEKYIQDDQVEKGKLNEKIQTLELKLKKKDKKKKKGKEEIPAENLELLSVDNQQLEMIAKNYEFQIKEMQKELESIKKQEKKGTDDNLKQLLDNKLIEELQSELVEYKTKCNDLQQELEQVAQASTISEIPSEVQDEINNKILAFEEENSRLQREVKNTNATVDRLIDEIDGYLKETANQSEEIAQKNSKINALNTRVESLKVEVKELQEKLASPLERVEDSIKTQMDDSTELITALKNEKKELGEEISAMTEQNMALTEEISDLKEKIDQNEELINSLKEKNQELEAVISEYREKEVEQPIEIGSNQGFVQPFDEESESIIRDLKNENQNLIQELNNLKSKQTPESDSLKKIEELTIEIQRLKEKKSRTSTEPAITQQEFDVQLHLPKSYQAQLFTSMLENLDSSNKEKMIDSLIQDLQNHENFEVKRNAMSILSHVNNERVNKAFANMIHDENWLVRFYLVKIASKSRNPELRKLIYELVKDSDIDVKEEAKRFVSHK